MFALQPPLQEMTNHEVKPLLLLPTLLLMLLLTHCQTSAERAENTDQSSSAGIASDDGFVPIFDGRTLDGWDGDTVYWRVEDGCLVGEITPDQLLETNSFIIWQGGEPGNFELKTEFRITEAGNSGINYRSERLDTIPYALRGYQADIDGKRTYTGQNYEERKRATLAYRGQQVTVTSQPNPEEPGSLRANVTKNAWGNNEVTASLGESDSLRALIRHEDWNECHLVVQDNRLRHYINGVLMSDVTDNDTVNRMMAGQLGMQVHVGPPMRVAYRNIRLKDLSTK